MKITKAAKNMQSLQHFIMNREDIPDCIRKKAVKFSKNLLRQGLFYVASFWFLLHVLITLTFLMESMLIKYNNYNFITT